MRKTFALNTGADSWSTSYFMTFAAARSLIGTMLSLMTSAHIDITKAAATTGRTMRWNESPADLSATISEFAESFPKPSSAASRQLIGIVNTTSRGM